LQTEIKAITFDRFEFRNTRTVTRVSARGKAYYSAILRHLEARNLSFYTFHPYSLKPLKEIIVHLLGDTPAEDTSNELVALGFAVISVRQMIASNPNLREEPTKNLPSLWMLSPIKRNHL
jgi:hypothetical protein